MRTLILLVARIAVVIAIVLGLVYFATGSIDFHGGALVKALETGK